MSIGFRDPGLGPNLAPCEYPGMAGTGTDLHLHLRHWRRARGLTLEQLANRIGSKTSTISGWETGSRRVDLDDLRRIAAEYGVHPAALLFAPAGSPELQRLQLLDGLLRRLDAAGVEALIRIAEQLGAKEGAP